MAAVAGNNDDEREDQMNDGEREVALIRRHNFGSRYARAGDDRDDDEEDQSTSEPVAKRARTSLIGRTSVSKQTTIAQAVLTKLEWRIENFAKVLKLYKAEQNLCSRQFTSPACPSIIWELHLYPNGKREEDAGNTSFFLRQVGMQNWTLFDPLFADFQMYCVTDGDDRLSVCRDTKEFTHQQGRGKFKIPRERIQSAIQSDGSLVVVCEIEFFLPGSKPEIDDAGSSDDGDSDVGDTLDLSELLHDSILPDCVIKIGNETLDAHRCILALHSEVFRSCFTQDGMQEAKEGIIEITDSFVEPVKGMLEWMYQGRTAFMTEYAEWILELAEKYDIDRLKARCEHHLARCLTLATVCQNIAFAEMHNAHYLMEACQRFIMRHQKEVLNSLEWRELKQRKPSLTTDVLQRMVTGTVPASPSFGSQSDTSGMASTSGSQDTSAMLSDPRVVVRYSDQSTPSTSSSVMQSASNNSGENRADSPRTERRRRTARPVRRLGN